MRSRAKINYTLTPDLDRSFAAWWAAYPRKMGKQTCKQLWGYLRPDKELVERMLHALAWQRESTQWQDAKYIPLPSTWLNQHRWEDEPTEQLQQSTWTW